MIIPTYPFPNYRLEPTEEVSLGVACRCWPATSTAYPRGTVGTGHRASGACSKPHTQLTVGGEISKLTHHTMEPALSSETSTQAPGEQATVFTSYPTSKPVRASEAGAVGERAALPDNPSLRPTCSRTPERVPLTST